MARVNEGSHSFTCHRHVYLQVNYTCLYSPAAERHRTFGRYSFSVPLTVEGWVGLSGWSQTEVVYTPAACHPSRDPSTNRARSRATSLIETNALPLSQAVHTVNCFTCPSWVFVVVEWKLSVSSFTLLSSRTLRVKLLLIIIHRHVIYDAHVTDSPRDNW